MVHDFTYCPSLTRYVRRKSREVSIGDVPLGGSYPIRIQSMTTTDTMDTEATVEECIRLIERGCDYVRITAPSIREAENVRNIKNRLREKGYRTPLIADIHFTPRAAETAARIVEKIRINPGNFADRKKFQVVDYSDESYNAELERIYKRFAPLVKVCREYGTAMRIGTNHGSLSDRILSRYGDTPLGMVESALEFIRICEDNDYHDIVLSMKASNPLIMVQAYRLLVNRMDKENMHYPLHLGVTEAGEGEDGRIKSALGIGALLEDGLGDTIRVSLTEPPENEIPVTRNIINRYSGIQPARRESRETAPPYNPFQYGRRFTARLRNIGGDEVPRVIADYSARPPGNRQMSQVGYGYNRTAGTWSVGSTAVDYLYLGSQEPAVDMPENIGLIYDSRFWLKLTKRERAYPLFKLDEYFTAQERSERLNFISVRLSEFDREKIRRLIRSVLILEAGKNHTMRDFRNVFFRLIEEDIAIPVIVKKEYSGLENEEILLNSAIDFGGLFIDGLGNGIWMSSPSEYMNRTVFGILQASRTRITKTEYISCPSCGRTLFDLAKTSTEIRERTHHLKGVKIGIMGCIVNGPGEMADADYGYVGAGIGKVSLYRRQNVVMKNIPSDEAVKTLIGLIKEDGRWVEPENKSR